MIEEYECQKKVKFEIKGDPVPWQTHKGYGKYSYNPRYKEREAVQWQLKSQYQGHLLGGPLQITYTYHIDIPKNTSKKERIRMGEGLLRPTKRPDLDNYNKFLNDCLNKVVIVDDSLIVKLVSEKYYSDNPRVEIEISEV
jgi:Holliday junction resolvase RusA-like endonuclease